MNAMTHPTPSLAFAFALAAAFAPCARAQAEKKPQEVQGPIQGTLRLSGEVRLVGDVTVEPDGRLEIAKGTTIVVAAQDARRGGFQTDLVEIHVKGQLVIEGDLESPVLFRGERELDTGTRKDEKPQWHGIVFHPKKGTAKDRDRILGTQFEAATAAIQVPAGDPLIEDCVFRVCGVGIESGTAYQNDRLRGLPDGAGAPEIRRCRFADCKTGVYAAAFATPVVDRCVFFRCSYGVGPDRPGWTGPLEKPGASIQKCAFVQCGVGITGCSMTRESLFANTITVLKLSDFHDEFAVDIEQVVLEGCAVHDSSREVVGDTGAARAVLRHAFSFSGSLEGLNAPWPPLPDLLRLQGVDAEPALARIGPLSKPVLSAQESGLPGSEKWLKGWLAAPADAGDWTKLQKAAPGAMALQSWWALADAEPDGMLRARTAFGLVRTGGLLALEVQSEAGGDAKLLALGDLEQLEVSCNGGAAAKVQKRRRFRGEPWQLPIKLKKGPNTLLVKATGWGVDPKLALWIDGDATPVPPQAPAAAPSAPLTATARGSKARDGTYVEVTFSQPVHFRGPGGEVVAKVRSPASAEAPLAVSQSWSGYKKLKLGPLSGDLAKGSLEIHFPGLRDPMGQPLQLAPVAIKLP